MTEVTGGERNLNSGPSSSTRPEMREVRRGNYHDNCERSSIPWQGLRSVSVPFAAEALQMWRHPARCLLQSKRYPLCRRGLSASTERDAPLSSNAMLGDQSWSFRGMVSRAADSSELGVVPSACVASVYDMPH